MKLCKGTGKAKGCGCGVELRMNRINGIPVYHHRLGLCIRCQIYHKHLFVNKIKPRSKTRAEQEKEYKIKRLKFLENNPKCTIFKHLKATDVHHMKGRIGSLLLDERFWLPVSREAHKKIEENPIWAKENGYSLDRLSK